MENDAVSVRWMQPALSPSAPAAPGGRVLPVRPRSCRLVAIPNLSVIGIQHQSDRELARRAIRLAILAELGQSSRLPPERIALHAEPGEAPWALFDTPAGERRAWLAISHDGELSVAAIRLRGAVGIDVSRIEDPATFPDWEAVARDYLGPQLAAALALLPARARMAAFARAWSEREARLKCLGRQLTEWRPQDEDAVNAYRCLPLALPEGYAGALALAPAEPI
jgi:4'-phosphopantetheinyl transferase